MLSSTSTSRASLFRALALLTVVLMLFAGATAPAEAGKRHKNKKASHAAARVTEHCDKALYPNKVASNGTKTRLQTGLEPGTEVCIKASTRTTVVVVDPDGFITQKEIRNKRGVAQAISYYAYGQEATPPPPPDPCDDKGGDIDDDQVCETDETCETQQNCPPPPDPCDDKGGDTDNDDVCEADETCETQQNCPPPPDPCVESGGDSDEDGTCDDDEESACEFDGGDTDLDGICGDDETCTTQEDLCSGGEEPCTDANDDGYCDDEQDPCVLDPTASECEDTSTPS